MDQEYIKVCGILETGTDLVSPHLRWLLRQAIVDYCPTEAINQICFNKDIPKNLEAKGDEEKEIWGETHAPSKSICINLEHHFNHAVDSISEEKSMYTSIRCMIIRELLDTSIHEAHHLKTALESNTFENSELDEKGAQKAGWHGSWMAAKYWDIEILKFGPFLDRLLEDFIAGLKEDTAKTPVMWKDLQVYMWENKLAFYNPDKEQECKMFETFKHMAQDENPWTEQPKTYVEETPISETINEHDDTIAPENIQLPVNPVLTNPQPAMVAPLTPAVDTLAGTCPTPESVPVMPATQQQPQIQTPPVQNYDTLTAAEIQVCAETVIRTLFWHVKEKCEFNTEGTYNNPQAVLDPINISHIPYADKLFTHMDTLTELGAYIKEQPCQGIIKGLVDSNNMPMYRFYLNFAGKLHIRSLVCHNPVGKTGKWATEAREGTMRMSLQERVPKIGPDGTIEKDETGRELGENKIRADIKLKAGEILGKEEYNLWSN